MTKTICVFCSSSAALDTAYFDAAAELGIGIGKRGWSLVYGGTDIGLMGRVAKSTHEGGGKVIGVIPETLHARGIGYSSADEFIVTVDLRQRKAVMDSRADAFVTLPGGFGTLEEVIEVLTLKQLQLHDKPIVFLNTNGFYDPLMSLFEHFYEQKFAKPSSRQLYHIAPNAADVLTYIESYQPTTVESKWF